MTEGGAGPGAQPEVRHWLLIVLLVVLGGLIITAVVDDRHNADALATDFAAHRLVVAGDISAPPEVAQNYPRQFEQVEGRWISNRAPALILWQVPFHAALGDAEFYDVPGRIAAIAATTLTALLLFLVFVGNMAPRTAAIATLVFVFATATWAISGRYMMPHALGQLSMAAGLLALRRGGLPVAGTAFALGILARPVLAFVPLVIGSYLAWRHRSWRAVVQIGFPSVVGMILLLVWNSIWFGELTVTGGYSDAFVHRLADQSLPVHLSQLAGMFLDPRNGMLTWSPFLLLLLPGIGRAWRIASPEVRGPALAGLIYLAVHARLNRVSGGLAFDYRYQLEALTLAAPLLVLAFQRWTAVRPLSRRLMILAIVLSLVLQGSYVFGLRCSTDAPVEYCRLWRE